MRKIVVSLEVFKNLMALDTPRFVACLVGRRKSDFIPVKRTEWLGVHLL